MAQQRDFVIDQGSDITIELHLKNQDGSSKDLSGHALRGKIKKTYDTTDSDQIFDFTNVSVASPAEDGIALITISSATSDTMKSGRYVYDIELLSGADADIVERILEGKLNVTPSVTK
jgi:hypothetical protein